ncbi:MAG: hypothetical protein JSS02_00840 [Planctomycetes bacterium]|nr:hypothetical protein [Planctomycetota bacterium]
MTLTCEDHDPIDDVSEKQLDEILSSDVFGKFAILSNSDSAFIQAASDWQPTDECAAFLEANDSDPWLLERRDGSDDTHFRVQSYVTLDVVRAAFKAYLSGDTRWQTDFVWERVAT